jgi:hypothetical protein
LGKYQVKGADVVMKNMLAFGNKFSEEVNADFRIVEQMLKEAIKKNISLSDHSLADLAALGHPYAANAPQHIHDPDYQVHTQGGGMLSGLFSGTEALSISGGTAVASAYSGIDEAINYAIFVLLGTSKMIPRDFLSGSLEEIRTQVFETLRRSLNHVTINFNGEQMKL